MARERRQTENNEVFYSERNFICADVGKVYRKSSIRKPTYLIEMLLRLAQIDFEWRADGEFDIVSWEEERFGICFT